jgi:allophanate hydrolase subunit 1
MIYERCRDILLQEHELIQNAVILQEKIRSAVVERKWTGFEDLTNSMKTIEVKLEILENERERLFDIFEALTRKNNFLDKKDSKGRFYQMVCRLPESQRSDLTSIYRSLKLEAIRMRITNEQFMDYLGGTKAALKDFFEIAFPDRGGKMYTKAGTHLSHDMRSMVLNRSF